MDNLAVDLMKDAVEDMVKAVVEDMMEDMVEDMVKAAVEDMMEDMDMSLHSQKMNQELGVEVVLGMKVRMMILPDLVNIISLLGGLVDVLLILEEKNEEEILDLSLLHSQVMNQEVDLNLVMNHVVMRTEVLMALVEDMMEDVVEVMILHHTDQTMAMKEEEEILDLSLLHSQVMNQEVDLNLVIETRTGQIIHMVDMMDIPLVMVVVMVLRIMSFNVQEFSLLSHNGSFEREH